MLFEERAASPLGQRERRVGMFLFKLWPGRELHLSGNKTADLRERTGHGGGKKNKKTGSAFWGSLRITWVSSMLLRSASPSLSSRLKPSKAQLQPDEASKLWGLLDSLATFKNIYTE